jgi:hypothetical protein
MNSDKACYWLAVGVLAVGLGHSFTTRHMGWIHDISMRAVADQFSGQICDRVSGHTSGLDQRVTLALNRSQSSIERAQAAASRVQSRMACIQAKMAQKQASFDRIQSESDRIQAQVDHALANVQAHHVVVIPPPNRDVEMPTLRIIPNDGTI